MFKTGTLPDKLKITTVIPLYKTEDEPLFSNYCPISLLPIISKIVEKLFTYNCSITF